MVEVVPSRSVLEPQDALEELRSMLSSWGGAWFLDKDGPFRISFKRVKGSPFLLRTRYQQMELVELEGYGLCLILDGKVQLAASDERIYHELLVHPACVIHGSPCSVLILGGGDGCAARELLRYEGIHEIVIVDIDEEVVAVFRERFRELNCGSLEDPRVKVVPRDAMEFLKQAKTTYDIIISDLTEPFDPAERAGDLSAHLYSPEAYALIKKRLAPGGVFVCQSGGVLYQSHYDQYHMEILRGIKECFPHVAAAYEFVPSFEAMWSITLASLRPLEISWKEVDQVLSRLGVRGLLHYDGQAHQRAFSTPRLLGPSSPG
ncbi:MAG: methyltransferase domain-containing protein [bacterium]